MSLKLDISKAQDKVRREFIFDMLTKLDFNDTFIKIIRIVVNTIRFFILVDGGPSRFSSFSRGL